MNPPLDRAASLPTFSIAIEWENARFAELERTRRMLRALREQLCDLPAQPEPPQIIFIYDREVIDGEMVQNVVAEEFKPELVPARTRIIATQGLRYYEQKNFGALQTDTEVKIFLDCDVVPEPGWLAALLDSFQNPEVGTVAGQTYIEYDNTLYSKAFALFWFFPLRDPNNELHRSTHFHANNVAFRSDIFARFPFPDIAAYRGHCGVLADTLTANGVGIYVQKRARVSHPTPLGLHFFMARAMNNGRDDVLVARARVGRNSPLPLRSVYWNFFQSMKNSFRKFRKHAREVGLNPGSAVAAYVIPLSYFSLKALGELLTFMRPNLVCRLFKV